MSKNYLLSSYPFVVITRSSEKLMNTLMRDNHPILFEGLHCCFHLTDERLKERIKIVRTHNIEHHYYENLSKVERSIFKKIYFEIESKKLKRFEKNLAFANHILAISPSDTQELSSRYKNVHHITAFHSNDQINIDEEKGSFCLYHGNLEVGENNEAAIYLVKEVFSKTSKQLIIAGRKPSNELQELCKNRKNITLKANISTQEIDELINNAQINILPTFQATGIKLKLLAALFNGKYCIVNSPMVENTGLEKLCIIKNDSKEMSEAIDLYFDKTFGKEEIGRRSLVLNELFSNEKNVEKLIQLI